MFSQLKRNLLSACILAVASTSQAADTVPVTLEPIRHARAELVVVGPNGPTHYDPAALEALGPQRMTTITPWREEETDFDGVLLTDVLEANGLSDAEAIRVIAENEYAVVIDAQTWKETPILLATRVNGKPHTRRERGPIQFILQMSGHPNVGLESSTSNWVWMAARIEAVD